MSQNFYNRWDFSDFGEHGFNNPTLGIIHVVVLFVVTSIFWWIVLCCCPLCNKGKKELDDIYKDATDSLKSKDGKRSRGSTVRNPVSTHGAPVADGEVFCVVNEKFRLEDGQKVALKMYSNETIEQATKHFCKAHGIKGSHNKQKVSVRLSNVINKKIRKGELSPSFGDSLSGEASVLQVEEDVEDGRRSRKHSSSSKKRSSPRHSHSHHH